MIPQNEVTSSCPELIFTYICTYIHIYVFMYMYIYTQMYIRSSRRTRSRRFAQSCLYVCVYIYTYTNVHVCIHIYICTHINQCLIIPQDEYTSFRTELVLVYIHLYIDIHVQPSSDRVAENLEIISKNCRFCTRRTRILMGFIISTMILPGTNRKSHVHDSGSLKKF